MQGARDNFAGYGGYTGGYGRGRGYAGEQEKFDSRRPGGENRDRMDDCNNRFGRRSWKGIEYQR